MLRLVFHDAATFDAAAGDGGADASVAFELDRAENFGLKRGWRVIEKAQELLKVGTPFQLFDPLSLLILDSHVCCKASSAPSLRHSAACRLQCGLF